MAEMETLKIGFALSGSFCTFEKATHAMQALLDAGFDITAILSTASAQTDTRFGNAADMTAQLREMTGRPVIDTIAAAEPIGPQKLFSLLIVAPATGNTLAKIAAGIADTPVTLAVKSHLRNNRPVVLAVSTNDALGGNAKNIGVLLARKHIYFVPFRQDDPAGKPNSMVADFTKITETVRHALSGIQLQPVIAAPETGG